MIYEKSHKSFLNQLLLKMAAQFQKFEDVFTHTSWLYSEWQGVAGATKLNGLSDFGLWLIWHLRINSSKFLTLNVRGPS